MFRSRESLVACAVAAMILAPYTAILVPFQSGLRLQFAVIVLSLVVAWAAMRTAAEKTSGLPRAVQAGLLLYAAAAVWGLVVGLAAGNPLRFIASQSAAMLLLPAAAVAFSGTLPSKPRAVAVGTAVAAPIALLMHCVSIVIPELGLADPMEPFRFLLRNDASLTGAAPLLSFLLLGYWLATRRRWALIGWLGVVALVIGIMSRGGWLVAAVGMAGVSVAMARRRRVAATALVLSVGGLGAAWVLAMVVFHHSARVLFDARDGGHRGGAEAPWCFAVASPDGGVYVPLVERLEPEGAGLEIVVDYRGPAGHKAVVVMDETATDGSADRVFLSLVGVGARTVFDDLVPLRDRRPPLGLFLYAAEGEGEWVIHRLRVIEVRSLAELYLRQFNVRLHDLTRSVTAPLSDRNLGYRAKETDAVWSKWRDAGLARQLMGHGLGATYAFPNSSWDAQGRRVTVPVASYIHNFYVFLGFKLGLAGLAVLAGLLMILVWAWRESRRADREAQERWPQVVLVAGLATYLLWSITSPELYDFRVAPLWGILIPVANRTVQREGY